MKAMKITAIILALLICISAFVACDKKSSKSDDDGEGKKKDNQSQEELYDYIVDELTKASKQDALTVGYRWMHDGAEDREYADFLCMENSNGWKAYISAGAYWMYDTWYEKVGDVYNEYGTYVLDLETMETETYCRVLADETDFESQLILRCLDISEFLSHLFYCNECNISKIKENGTETIKVAVSKTGSCDWCEENGIENMYFECTITNGLISKIRLGSSESWGEYVFEYACAPIKLPKY